MPFLGTPERLGLKQGLLTGLEVSLKVKFGEEGLRLLPELRTLDHEMLGAVLKAIETAASPDELRHIWAPKRRTRKKRRT